MIIEFIKKSHLFHVGMWSEKHIPRWITGILAAVHFGLGIGILVGGRVRFPEPSYGPLVHYTGGHTWVWGLIIGLTAFLMTAPVRWFNIIGLWIAMTWHLLWMSCFVISVVHLEGASSTTIPTFAGFAALNAALLTARVLDKE